MFLFRPILFCLFCVGAVSAQVTVPVLQPGTPFETEITDRKTPKQFTVQLLANQTASVEVEQTWMDVSLTTFDPDGEKLLEWGLPLGRFGSESLLILAEKTGDYRIVVKPGNRHARLGKIVVNLTNIRETTEGDRIKYNAAKEISRIKPEAFRLARLDQGSSRRQSIELWNEVARLARIKEDKLTEARALNAIGTLLLDLNETQEAIDVNLKVLEMWRELKNRRYEGIALSRFGYIWHELGEYERAIASYKESLKIYREINSRFDVATCLGNLGEMYLSLGQPATAIKYLEEVLPIYAKMKAVLYQAYAYNDLGRAYIAIGDYQKGIELQEKGLAMLAGNYRGESIRFYITLGKVYKDLGQLDKAYENLMQAKPIAAELGSQIAFVQSTYNLALIESERGNLDEALENLEDALEVVEKTRDKIRNKTLRTSYFATVQYIYELYSELLIKRAEKNKSVEDIKLAFEMSERSRSRSLVDLLQEARVDFRESVDKNLLQKQSDLSDQITAKYRTRERLISRKSKQEQIDKINGEINDLEIEAENLLIQIQTENPRYSNLIRGKIISVNEIQNLLDEETVLLEYKLGERRSHLWLLTKSSIKHYELPKRAEIETEARVFYDMTVRNYRDERDDIYKTSRRLDDILFSKVRSEIKGKRLVIVPDGMLQYLPFAALRDSESYIADKNEIVMLPSASVLAQLRAGQVQNKPNQKTLAIFADPVFDADDSRIAGSLSKSPKEESLAMQRVLRDFRLGETLPRLLASRQEARSISKLLQKDQVALSIDFEASLENIENENLKNYRILHFATHGLLNSSHPELSGLVFSLYDNKGKKQNGFLSLNDIYNLNLNSDMVVLSACQTALGKDVRGEGLIGMSRGFLYAGSKRIVASLWKVDDSATAEFMKRFYKNHLQKGMPASKALQQTKIEMKKIKRYESPYYWSAFTLLGDWKK